MKYYVDARIMEVVSEDDININLMAPELYWEYRRGIMEDIISEKWSCGGNKVIDFDLSINESNESKVRQAHFKRHGAEVTHLISYTVPPSWFDKTISGLEE